MAHDEDAGYADETATPNDRHQQRYPCPDCGVEDAEPRARMLDGGLTGSHCCFCRWEDQPSGPVCVATGICCYRMRRCELAAHHQDQRRWELLKSPRAVDWDEVASRVTSTRRVVGDLWRQAGWPEPSLDHARLLSLAHRSEHWPPGPSQGFWDGSRRKQMTATADEIAEWLMLARDRVRHGSGSLEASADVHAAGELLARFADALAAWDRWRLERVIEEAARVRRILAAAAFKWGGSDFMFRHFVADHLDATLAGRLGEREISVLACAIHLRRRGRPRKDDLAVRLLKKDLGLAPDEEVPDKIEALQRLAASIGIPRMSPDAVEDQVQPLLARLAEIRRERDAVFAKLQKQNFDSLTMARDAFEDADAYASVMEDEAVRSCGTRKKAPRQSHKKSSRSRAVGKSRRNR